MRPLPVLASAVLLFSGCGVVGTEFHPGIAATVGDQTLTTNHVDELTSGFCTAVEDQLTQAQQKLPLRYLRFGIAGELVLKAAVEQLADEYDVEPGVQYRQDLAQYRTDTADLDDDVADAFVEVQGASSYISDVLTSVGGEVLLQQGTTDPTAEQKQDAGEKALGDWFAEHEVEVDPRYGITITDGKPVAADTDLSYPLDATAKKGLKDDPDAGYAADLPSHLVCG